MITVLISQPNFYEDQVYLPYIYGVLRTYSEKSPTVQNNVEWLDPIYEPKSAISLLADYDIQKIDVLGLSCYQWNMPLQLDIAKIIKTKNPNCTVVMGGPEPDWKDQSFFDKYPYVDVVVRQDGEKPFQNILEHLIDDNHDFSDIPGLYLRDIGMSLTGPPHSEREFDYLPFSGEVKSYFRRISRGKSTYAIWETNRGCPYGCTFCDWGSATMGKVRFIPMERLKEEARFFAEIGVDMIFIADANFGIHKRDMELADYLANQNTRNNNRIRVVAYTPAKNHAQNNLYIAKAFHNAGMIMNYSHSIQHTDQEVLDAISRTNLKEEDETWIIQELRKEGISIMPGMILGNPGDTPSKWFKAFTDVIEMGADDELRTHHFSLLPNSPAAQPDYMKKWEIGTVDRMTFYDTSRRVKDDDTERVSVHAVQTKYVVSTKTFDTTEWIRMNEIDSFFKAMHNHGLSRFLAGGLRRLKGISYQDIYKLFWNRLDIIKEPLNDVRNHMENYLIDSSLGFEMEIEDIESKYLYLPEEYLTYYLLKRYEDFYREVKQILLESFPQSDIIHRDLINFQKGVMIDPDYDPNSKRRIHSQYDWASFFSNDDPHPVNMRDKSLYCYASHVGPMGNIPLRYHRASTPEDKITKYIDQVIGTTNTRNKRSYMTKFVYKERA